MRAACWALHDEAVVAVNSGHFSGPVRVGMVQDFAETLLSGLLARFAALHPDSQIYARVAGTAELLGLLDRGQLDIVIGYAAADDAGAIKVSPMTWFGKEDLAERNVVPLAVLEEPCRFREAAIAGLEAARPTLAHRDRDAQSLDAARRRRGRVRPYLPHAAVPARIAGAGTAVPARAAAGRLYHPQEWRSGAGGRPPAGPCRRGGAGSLIRAI